MDIPSIKRWRAVVVEGVGHVRVAGEVQDGITLRILGTAHWELDLPTDAAVARITQQLVSVESEGQLTAKVS